jgi:hypothetical protein
MVARFVTLSMALGAAGCSLVDLCYLNRTTCGENPDGGHDAAPLAFEAGGPSLCPGDFAFCDGFEQGLGAWSLAQAGGGTASVSTTHVYRGNYALSSELPSTAAAGTSLTAVVTHPQNWPEPLFARVFAYVSSPSHRAPANATNLLLLNNTSPDQGTSVFVAGNSQEIGLSTFGVADANGQSHGVMPLEQWVCIELEADGANATVWIDGSASPVLTLPFAIPTATLFLDLGQGYISAGVTDTTFEAWFDEIAVNKTRVGCDD